MFGGDTRSILTLDSYPSLGTRSLTQSDKTTHTSFMSQFSVSKLILNCHYRLMFTI